MWAPNALTLNRLLETFYFLAFLLTKENCTTQKNIRKKNKRPHNPTARDIQCWSILGFSFRLALSVYLYLYRCHKLHFIKKTPCTSNILMLLLHNHHYIHHDLLPPTVGHSGFCSSEWCYSDYFYYGYLSIFISISLGFMPARVKKYEQTSSLFSRLQLSHLQ